MKRKDREILLRALKHYQARDEDEAWEVQQIRLRLYNAHPDQIKARAQGDKLKNMSNRLLIIIMTIVVALGLVSVFLR